MKYVTYQQLLHAAYYQKWETKIRYFKFEDQKRILPYLEWLKNIFNPCLNHLSLWELILLSTLVLCFCFFIKLWVVQTSVNFLLLYQTLSSANVLPKKSADGTRTSANWRWLYNHDCAMEHHYQFFWNLSWWPLYDCKEQPGREHKATEPWNSKLFPKSGKVQNWRRAKIWVYDVSHMSWGAFSWDRSNSLAQSVFSCLSSRVHNSVAEQV